MIGKGIPIDKTTPLLLYSVCLDSSFDSTAYLNDIILENFSKNPL